ncbi:MAG: N-glycosylase/DNA lyase [Candidatus Micrarchaeota archaeon]
MEELISQLELLRRGPVGKRVRSRMAEFRAKGAGCEDGAFKELCFCLLTANYSAEGGIRIQEAIGDGFIRLPERELARRLKSLGYRFPNARARYIVEARAHLGTLRGRLSSMSAQAVRDWLAANVLGLGYKESSHFLRNLGFTDFAIIDFHIIDLLARHRLIRKPRSKSLTKKRYLLIEKALGRIAARAGLNQGELDLYLWYMETGKILK